MKGFLAALYKDTKLVMNGAGVLTLLFALALLPVFWYGTRDLSQDEFVRPFPIAVRDLDQTVMSRSLISQMREIELFSEIETLGETQSDADALQKGAAAVVTIPLDFFYAMYTGRDCPVDVVLNENRALEATLVQSIFTSVMDIILADQTAWRGVYAYVYGAPDDAALERMYESASRDIFSDALSRQRVFDTDITQSDIAGVTRRRLVAVLLPMLAMLFSLAALQTLPQEQEMGTLMRYRAIGAPLSAFVLSKFLTCVFWMAPMTALLYFLSGVGRCALFLLLCALTLFASFGVMLCIVSFTGDENAARRWCNLYLLLSLFLGGTLLNATKLPAALHPVRAFTVARYAYPVLNALDAQEGADRVCLRMAPLALMGIMGCALSVLGRRMRRAGYARGAVDTQTTKAEGTDAAVDLRAAGTPHTGGVGTVGRTLALTMMKTNMYAGGVIALIAACCAAAIVGYAVMGARGGDISSLTIAVNDLDQTDASEELLRLTGEKVGDGLTVILCDEADGVNLLIDGVAEGLFTIGSGYADALRSDAATPLSYTGTASAFSAQGMREIVAGQVALQRAVRRAYLNAERLLGRALTDDDRAEIDAAIARAKEELPPLYRLQTLSGAPAGDPFQPERIGFLALTVILAILTAAGFTARRDARSAETRLLGARGAMCMTYGADLLALSCFGFALCVCFFLPDKAPTGREALAAALLCVNVAAFSLLITRMTARAGRVDALAPILTLIVCLLGGCFLDLSSLSQTIARWMMLSPAGAALFASKGAGVAVVVLLVETALFILPGRARRK